MTLTADITPNTQTYLLEPYLAAHIDWLHRLLDWQTDVTRSVYGAVANDEYRGLYVSEDEVDIFRAGLVELPYELQARRRFLADERAELAQHVDASNSPLYRLAYLFGLDVFACDVLLLALLPEIDPRYEKWYGYLQDDVTKKHPTVHLALRLLCFNTHEQTQQRMYFTPDSPLLRHHLIQLYVEGQPNASLLSHFVKLDGRIVAELFGHATVDASLEPFVTQVQPNRALDDVLLPPELAGRLRHTVVERAGGLTLALQGSYGSGRRAVAEALCDEAGLSLLCVDLHRLADAELDPQNLAHRLMREATLQGAAMLWQGASRVFSEDGPRALRQALLSALDEYSGCVFLALDQAWEARDTLRHMRYLRVELPPLAYSEREHIWRARLADAAFDDTTFASLASTFRLSGGQIRDAVAMAHSLARWQGGTRALTAQDVFAACRAQSSGKLDSIAHKISATYAWNDIVLPADQMHMLGEICAQVRQRRVVLERWGFDRHLAMGKGVNVLFAGTSGTGKTMAAEIIAADLGMELYKVDLSSLVSKYIGETEKNLDRIFTAAREANAILFFDEADSIFGKRSEVKDSHDRYANIEVGYLLQKMEEYDGVVILATNLRKNLDDAFVRRLHVAIDFPFPEEADRLRIWRKAFPAAAPLADDVDHAFLARQFKLAGGNIRNIALLSAFLAAEEGDVITIGHIVRATRREYQKLGKLVTETDFGPYLSKTKRG